MKTLTDKATACTGCKRDLPTFPTHLGTQLCPFCIEELSQGQRASFTEQDLEWAEKTIKAIALAHKEHDLLKQVEAAAREFIGSFNNNMILPGARVTLKANLEQALSTLDSMRKAGLYPSQTQIV